MIYINVHRFFGAGCLIATSNPGKYLMILDHAYIEYI